jgi:hypothetical protein
VGSRLLDLIVLREKSYKRDIKLLNALMFVRGTLWKNLFNKEADKLERSNDDPCKCKFFCTLYLLINNFSHSDREGAACKHVHFIAKRQVVVELCCF